MTALPDLTPWPGPGSLWTGPSGWGSGLCAPLPIFLPILSPITHLFSLALYLLEAFLTHQPFSPHLKLAYLSKPPCLHLYAE